MKKQNYLLTLFVSVFLLLCACAGENAEQISSAATTPSSVPITSTTPSSAPTASEPATTVPTTTVPPTSVPPTTAPPTTAPPIQISTDWAVETPEYIPFEERFVEDVPFSAGEYPHIRGNLEWLVATEDGNYAVYEYGFDFRTEKFGILHNYNLIYPHTKSCDHTSYTPLIADGQYVYSSGSGQVVKENPLTGECSVLLQKGENIVRWGVYSCGNDTLCIFALDTENNLRVFYRDLHSDAEKLIYEGKLPETPLDDLSFTAPTTTLGAIRWQMMNPEFYTILQAELANPNSQFKTSAKSDYSKYWDDSSNHAVSIESLPFLCIAIQDHYKIPARVKYTFDPKTGELSADYGIIDSCERGSGDYNDHFNYENTWEEPLIVVDPQPVAIPEIIKLTEAQAEETLEDAYNSLRIDAFLFSDFGYGKPYVNRDDIAVKLADIDAYAITGTPHYVYCITTENTVVQISLDGSICNTIYTSDGVLDDLCYLTGSIYFKDGNEIIRIDTIAGTRNTILRSEGTMSLDSFGEEGLYILVVQGLYNQQYFFHPDTGILEETGFI